MEKVDCIVVGGGLAGLSAAYGLAREGVEVMVLERGNYAGSKNVTGGRLYTSVLHDVYPELWEEAAADGGPFERPVVREADHAARRRRRDDGRTGVRPSGGAVAAVVHGRARAPRPVAGRQGHRGRGDGRHRHEGRRAAARERPRDRRARRRRRGRRRRDDRLGRRARTALRAARGCACSPAPPTTHSATRRSSSCRPARSRTAGTSTPARARRSCSWATSRTA